MSTNINSGVAEPGVTTTEFMGKTAVQLVSIVTGFATLIGFRLDPGQQALLLSILTVGVPVVAEVQYIWGRSIRKKGTPG